MITTARQGCVRSLIQNRNVLSSCFLSLPSESSRQAQSRIQIQRMSSLPSASNRLSRKGKEVIRPRPSKREAGAGYGTAAVAVAFRDEIGGVEHVEVEPPDRDWGEREPRGVGWNDRPRGRDHDPHTARLDTVTNDGSRATALPHTSFAHSFRSQIRENPLEALVLLGSLKARSSAFKPLFVEDIDDLLSGLLEVNDSDIARFRRKHPRVVEESLSRLKQVLLWLPTHPISGDEKQGVHFKASRLRRFFDVCLLFKCESLVIKTFRQRLEAQVLSDQAILPDLDDLAASLRYKERWKLIFHLFSNIDYPAKRPTLPNSLLTPYIIETLIYARLSFNEPFVVAAHFEQYANSGLTPTTAAYDYLLQATISLADFARARELMEEVNFTGDNRDTRQVATLRGYRALGGDGSLAEQTMQDLGQSGAQPSRELLHELILTQIGRGDHTSARALLGRFDLNALLQGERPSGNLVEADNETFKLALRASADEMPMADLERWWMYVCDTPSLLNDPFLALFVKTMCRRNLREEATAMLEAAVTDTVPKSKVWRLSNPAAAGIETLNTLLRAAIRTKEYSQVSRTTEIMRKADVRPDESTVQIVIDYARNTLHAHPADLAQLYKFMLKGNKHIRATVAQIDSIMSQAVAHASTHQRSGRSRTVPLSPSAGPTADMTAGINPAGEFAKAIGDILDTLRQRGAHSTARSLANRLRRDAVTSQSIGGIPAARIVWNEMLEHGYSPTKQHILDLMKGYASAGAMEEAESVLRLARDTGNDITRGMLMVLMEGFGAQGNVNLAEHAYRSIKRLPDGLDVVAVTSMVSIAYKNQRHTDALRISADFDRFPVEELDDQAIIVMATCSKHTGKIREALRMIQSRGGTGLNTIKRRLVKDCHRLLRRDGGSTVKDFELAEGMLAVDDVLRSERERVAEGRVLGNGLSTKAGRRPFLRLLEGGRGPLGVEQSGKEGQMGLESLLSEEELGRRVEVEKEKWRSRRENSLSISKAAGHGKVESGAPESSPNSAHKEDMSGGQGVDSDPPLRGFG